MIYINNFLMIWVARECLTGLRLHFYIMTKITVTLISIVSMPFRAGAPFLHPSDIISDEQIMNMYQCPLGLVLYFYGNSMEWFTLKYDLYQCPLGLVLLFYKEKIYVSINMGRVSMPFRASAPFLRKRKGENIMSKTTMYQCPFGLVLHFYRIKIPRRIKMKYWYQCPFGLVLHFYGTPSKT